MAWADILEHEPAIDSIILHEGEQSIVDLSSALLGRHDKKGK
jgi:hypothetical protein